MKRTLLATGSALALAIPGVTTASASQPEAAASSAVQATQGQDGQEPDRESWGTHGSIYLERSDCTVGYWNRGGWPWEEPDGFTCFIGPYDTWLTAHNVAFGWATGGANVTGSRAVPGCGPYYLPDYYCAEVWATG